MLEPSPRLRKEATRLACDANHIILADLILSGYSEAEAYDIAYSENISWGAQRKIAHREKVLVSEGYKRAYDEKRNSRKYNAEFTELRDKTSVATELNALINQTQDPKLKAELLMKLADLQQMKKDAAAVDEDPVQFFLPISCERCPLLQAYNDFLADKNKELPPNKWEVQLRPDEMQMLIEQVVPEIREIRKAER